MSEHDNSTEPVVPPRPKRPSAESSAEPVIPPRPASRPRPQPQPTEPLEAENEGPAPQVPERHSGRTTDVKAVQDEARSVSPPPQIPRRPSSRTSEETPLVPARRPLKKPEASSEDVPKVPIQRPSRKATDEAAPEEGEKDVEKAVESEDHELGEQKVEPIPELPSNAATVSSVEEAKQVSESDATNAALKETVEEATEQAGETQTHGPPPELHEPHYPTPAAKEPQQEKELDVYQVDESTEREIMPKKTLDSEKSESKDCNTSGHNFDTGPKVKHTPQDANQQRQEAHDETPTVPTASSENKFTIDRPEKSPQEGRQTVGEYKQQLEAEGKDEEADLIDKAKGTIEEQVRLEYEKEGKCRSPNDSPPPVPQERPAPRQETMDDTDESIKTSDDQTAAEPVTGDTNTSTLPPLSTGKTEPSSSSSPSEDQPRSPAVPPRPAKKPQESAKPEAATEPSEPEIKAKSRPAPPPKPKNLPASSKVGALRASLFSDLDNAISNRFKAPPPPPKNIETGDANVYESVGSAAEKEESASGSSRGVEKEKNASSSNRPVRATRASGPKRRLPASAKSEWTVVVSDVWDMQMAKPVEPVKPVDDTVGLTHESDPEPQGIPNDDDDAPVESEDQAVISPVPQDPTTTGNDNDITTATHEKKSQRDLDDSCHLGQQRDRNLNEPNLGEIEKKGEQDLRDDGSRPHGDGGSDDESRHGHEDQIKDEDSGKANVAESSVNGDRAGINHHAAAADDATPPNQEGSPETHVVESEFESTANASPETRG